MVHYSREEDGCELDGAVVFLLGGAQQRHKSQIIYKLPGSGSLRKRVVSECDDQPDSSCKYVCMCVSHMFHAHLRECASSVFI